MEQLFNLANFKSASIIDNNVPDNPGLYCLKIKDTSSLPSEFQKAIKSQNHPFIYIGIATKSLRKRMLHQELRAKGHGTFFRSLGAALGYLPPFNSLQFKKNKRNYQFSDNDERDIISWINKNIEVNWVMHNSEIYDIEFQLIKKYKPILNLDKNPEKLHVLSVLRKKCVDFANGISIL